MAYEKMQAGSQGYPQEMNQRPIVVQQASPAVGHNSTQMVCPGCQATIKTRVNYSSTSRTHLMAFLMCICLCWCCCCLPYCMGSCKNANHTCPNCDTFLGTNYA